ncbi:MAG: hypothetical protein ACRDQZ_23780, partial [Mycobacteriales bacterium]
MEQLHRAKRGSEIRHDISPTTARADADAPDAFRSKIDKITSREYSGHDRRAIVAITPLALEILSSALSFLKPSRSAIKKGLDTEGREATLEAVRKMPWSTIASILGCSEETTFAASKIDDLC